MVLAKDTEIEMLGTHIVSGLAFLYIIGQDLYQNLNDKAIKEGIADFGEKIFEFLSKQDSIKQVENNPDSVSSSSQLKEKSTINPRLESLFSSINPAFKDCGYEEISQEEQKLFDLLFKIEEKFERENIAKQIIDFRKGFVLKTAPYVGAASAIATLGLGIAAPLVPTAAKLPVLGVGAGLAGVAALSSSVNKSLVKDQKKLLNKLNKILNTKPSTNLNPLKGSALRGEEIEMQII